MKTLGEILTLSAEFLQKKGIAKPRRQVEELLSTILKLPRIELYMQFDRPMTEEELVRLREAIKKRAEGEPWQYIAGVIEFLDCQIQVSRSVLIPRQETEILAERIIKELPETGVEVWDLCTGSGCIGIAIKKKRPDCTVVMGDLSNEALEVAKINAEKNGVEVELLRGDLLTPFAGRKADVVICNPPYISLKEYEALDQEVRAWEPKMALVGGVTGYEFYERLARDLPSYLKPGAKVYFEIGTAMGEGVKKIFSAPQWIRHQLDRDWASHDRYYKLEIESVF